MQDGQPADAGVENADGPRIHGGDRRTGLPCRRSWAAESSSLRRCRCARLERLGARGDAAAADDRRLGRREARLLGRRARRAGAGRRLARRHALPRPRRQARGHGAARDPVPRARRATRRSSATRAATASRRGSSGSTARATCRTRASSSPGSRRDRRSRTRRSARSASRSAAAPSGTPLSRGVPFKAIVPVITWTNLADRARAAGPVEVRARAVPRRARARRAAGIRELLAAKAVARRRARTWHAVAALAASRSPVAKLPSITTPTLLIQGRHDFLFDIDQALAAYKALQGPEAPVPRRPRPLAGDRAATAPDAGDYCGEAVQVVRPFPERHGERHRQAGRSSSGTIRATARRRSYKTLPRDEDDLRDAARARRR